MQATCVARRPNAGARKGDLPEYCERLLGLAAYIRYQDHVVPKHEIRARVYGYHDKPTREAFEKAMDRDKTALRAFGVHLAHYNGNSNDDQGYIIKISPPPSPKIWERGGSLMQKIGWTLYQARKGLYPVASLMSEMGVERDDIRYILSTATMIRAGELPHEFIDAYIDGDDVVVQGPNPYARLR
jgi:hypothetical protein